MLPSNALNTEKSLCESFVKGAVLLDSCKSQRHFQQKDMAAGIVITCGDVGEEPVNRWLMLAYDDLYSIEFMHNKLRPYWRRNGLDAIGLLKESAE